MIRAWIPELTGPTPKEIKVETFRIDLLIRRPNVEKLSLQPKRVSERKKGIRTIDQKDPHYRDIRFQDPPPRLKNTGLCGVYLKSQA